MFEVVLAAIVILFIRNRVLHAYRQRQKEDFWREVSRRVDQKRKLDELYGRNQDR